LSSTLLIQNRQRATPINTRFLRTIIAALLEETLKLETFDLAINLVRAPEMACLNETFLEHEGSTDVITFDYAESPTCNTQAAARYLHGEIFISIDDAASQARQFRTTWQSELARYIIHGVLHLQGFDDLNPAARRKMKREENRLLKEINRRFPLRKLGRNSKLPA
jgi:probable rRNA maturation factor